MTMYRIILFFILSVTLSSLSLAQEEKTNLWFEGYWGGTGLQVDKQQWEVDLVVFDVEKPLINYPGLGCSGHWELQQPGKNKLVYKENITEGILSCDQGVEVYVKKRGKNKIRITYYLKSYSEEPIAKAILTRKPGPDRN